MTPTRALALALALAAAGCSHVTSSVAGQNTTNGDIYYTRSASLFNLPLTAAVWYCPPANGSGAPTCKRARMLREGESGWRVQSASGSGSSTRELIYTGKKKPAEDTSPDPDAGE